MQSLELCYFEAAENLTCIQNEHLSVFQRTKFVAGILLLYNKYIVSCMSESVFFFFSIVQKQSIQATLLYLTPIPIPELSA